MRPFVVVSSHDHHDYYHELADFDDDDSGCSAPFSEHGLTCFFDDDRQPSSPWLHPLPPSNQCPSPPLTPAISNQYYTYNNTHSQDVPRSSVNSSAFSAPSKATRHGPSSHQQLESSSPSSTQHVSLTSQSNSVALQQLANHYGIPSVLPKPPISKSTKQQQHQSPRSSPPLPDFQSQLSNYLSMLSQKPDTNPSTSSESVNPMTTNTKAMGAPGAPLMEKDSDALQSVVETLMASPEFSMQHTMSPSFTSPQSFLTSPFDTPMTQFDASPLFDETSPLIDFADIYNGTSPMGTPLFDEFNTSPIDDSPFLDVLNTPVMDGIDGLDMYAGGPLIDDGAAGMYKALEESTKQVRAAPSWDQLLKMSPETPSLDPSLVYPSPSVQSEKSFLPPTPPTSEPTTSALTPPIPVPSRRKHSAANGTRRNITPDSLVPIDAPTQERRYVTPSVTSKKEVPVTFARKKRKAMGGEAVPLDVDDEDDLPPLNPDASEREQIEYKRRQNTLAARKSRKRKLEYQQTLEQDNEDLKREVEAWKTRCELLSGMLKGAGINVDVGELAAST